MNDWIKDAPIAVTVCDADGVITEMNGYAAKIFAKNGGLDLIGSDLLGCHPEPARSKLKEMLLAPPEEPNVYTIEKNGVKKIIYQFACRKDGRFSGLVELSFEIPFKLPHFIRRPA
jgi:PAS domain-containing protein